MFHCLTNHFPVGVRRIDHVWAICFPVGVHRIGHVWVICFPVGVHRIGHVWLIHFPVCVHRTDQVWLIHFPVSVCRTDHVWVIHFPVGVPRTDHVWLIHFPVGAQNRLCLTMWVFTGLMRVRYRCSVWVFDSIHVPTGVHRTTFCSSWRARESHRCLRSSPTSSVLQTGTLINHDITLSDVCLMGSWDWLCTCVCN